MIDLKTIDKSWTLFLDRDGVINYEKHQQYINTWEEFKFYDGVKKAIEIFNKKFKRVIIITNQRGVAKGVTTMQNLQIIHKNMLAAIEAAGGKIDAIYFCPDFESNNRKPNTGMGLKAVNDFKDINLHKTIMVGNTLSDMQFGRNLGTKNIFLSTTKFDVDSNHKSIDAIYSSLILFALDL